MEKHKKDYFLKFRISTTQKMPSITDYSVQTMVDILDNCPTALYNSTREEMLNLISRVKGK